MFHDDPGRTLVVFDARMPSSANTTNKAANESNDSGDDDDAEVDAGAAQIFFGLYDDYGRNNYVFFNYVILCFWP